MKQPLVSVIVPTKNSAQFLDACLKSIKEQTYKDIELIVVDNNSTDNTKAIAQKYTDKIFNRGPERSAQRNYGVSESKGVHVLIIDSDMELTPRVVETCIERAQNSNIRGIVIPEESFGEGFWAQCKSLEKSFYQGIPWMEAARFFTREVYEQAGGYDETMVSGEDWDLSKRVEKLASIGKVKEPIRHNEGRVTLTMDLKKKYYYAGQARAYLAKNPVVSKLTSEVGPLKRYKLFLSQPNRLFRRPSIGIGMLFMKTSEFAAGGLGYFRNSTVHNKFEQEG